MCVPVHVYVCEHVCMCVCARVHAPSLLTQAGIFVPVKIVRLKCAASPWAGGGGPYGRERPRAGPSVTLGGGTFTVRLLSRTVWPRGSRFPFSPQFLCLKNIRTFLKVCHDKFGLRNSELFDPFDLFDVRDFGKVSALLPRLSPPGWWPRAGSAAGRPGNQTGPALRHRGAGCLSRPACAGGTVCQQEGRIGGRTAGQPSSDHSG